MGDYVNPEDGSSKEIRLQNNGERKSIVHHTFKDCPEHQLPVILMDNGPFTAAGICSNEHDWDVKTLPHDTRPKELYFVDKDKLKPFMRRT